MLQSVYTTTKGAQDVSEEDTDEDNLGHDLSPDGEEVDEYLDDGSRQLCPAL